MLTGLGIKMRYIPDTNVFVEAKNRYYSFDIAEGFWEWLEVFTSEQSFLTIKEVREEILDYPHDDNLKIWMKKFPLHCFMEADKEVQQNQRLIANYVLDHETFSPENKYKFLDGADPWLVAFAMVKDYTVVTHESKAGPGTKKVKIPNICEEFGVDYCNVFEVMREKRINLKLELGL